jgi:hypothetical protein
MVIIEFVSTLYPPCSVANAFGIWLHGVDNRFKFLLGWDHSPLFGGFGYLEMIRFSMIKFTLYAGHLSMHNFAPVMVLSTRCAES